MTKRRTDIGLHVITNGRDVSESVMPWATFMERVTEAAAKQTKKGARGPISNLDPGRPERLKNIPPERRCAFVHSKGPNAGKRCGLWAMRGARRCCKHGGYRENPAHPATIRRMGDIIARDQGKRAWQELSEVPAKPRAIVEATLRDLELPTRAAVVLEGVKAYLIDDNGRAWRRWVKHAKAARPSEGKQARRKQLR